MNTVERLREKARACRRLALVSTDDRAIEALKSKAREYEGAADLIVGLSPTDSIRKATHS